MPTKAKKQTLHLMHASSQYSDPVQLTEQDLSFYFSKEPDVISFTEMGTGSGNSHQAVMQRMARAHGYRPVIGPGDCQFAVKVDDNLTVKDNGAVPVHPGEKSPSGRDLYGRKYVSWVRLNFYGADIWHHCSHWVTFMGKSQLERDRHVLMSQAVARLVSERGQKGDAFFAGDMNADPDSKYFPTKIFSQNKLITCWEEAGTQVPTLARTIDEIGRYQPDDNVTFLRYKAWPYQNSDHRPFSVFYDIDVTKSINIGGNSNPSDSGSTGTVTGSGGKPSAGTNPNPFPGDPTDDPGSKPLTPVIGGPYTFADYTDDQIYALPYAVDDTDTFNG